MNILNLCDHPKWPSIRPYLRTQAATDSRNTRWRIWAAPDTPHEYFNITVLCPAGCGGHHHPLRRSSGKNVHTKGAAYVAVACPLTISIACSRSAAAMHETLRLAAALGEQEAAERLENADA